MSCFRRRPAADISMNALSREPVPNADFSEVVRTRFAPGALQVDGIWLRVRMDLLDPAMRSGWKLHLSSVPVEMLRLVEKMLPVLDAYHVPFTPSPPA